MLFSKVLNSPEETCFDPSRLATKIKESTHLQTAINRAMFVTKVLRMQKIRKDEQGHLRKAVVIGKDEQHPSSLTFTENPQG